jgi:hypothetical protein
MADEPQEGQFDPEKLRAAIEACRCSSSALDLHSAWYREHYQESFGLYTEVYEQGLAAEPAEEVYLGVPLSYGGSQNPPSILDQFAYSSSGSVMEMMTRRNEEAEARRAEALRVKEELIRAGEGSLMDMMSARD